MTDDCNYRIEFRWKEQVIYWEGDSGFIFDGGWGVRPPVTYVPDLGTWDSIVPEWLKGRHDEVVGHLRERRDHEVVETPEYAFGEWRSTQRPAKRPRRRRLFGRHR